MLVEEKDRVPSSRIIKSSLTCSHVLVEVKLKRQRASKDRLCCLIVV